MKRTISILVALVLLLGVPMVSALADAPVELDVWHYFSGQDGDRFAEFCARYDEAHPEVTVKVTFVSREDLMKQYTMGAISGELPDVGMVDNPDHAAFAAMGVFEDITDLLDASGDRDKYFEGPLKSTIYEDRVYGLPHNSNCLALFVNNDMFAEKGLSIPTTWDELLAACEAFKDTKVDGFFPFAMSAKNNEEGTFQFMPWFISAEGSIEDLAGENTVRSLDFLKQMVDKGYISKDVINMGQSDANTRFMNGLCAMQLNGPWNVPQIAQDAPNLNYSVALVPKDKKYASVLGGENFGVCAGAPLNEAYGLLSWLCSAEENANFAEQAGKFPVRSDSIAMKNIWTEDPIYKVFGEQLAYAMPRGPHPRWPEVSKCISGALNEALTGAMSAQDALNQAAAQYAEVMAK